MPNTAEVRKTVTDQGKAVLEDARKPLYAFVGAGDLVLARASHLRELPGDTQSAMDTRVKEVRGRIDDWRADVRQWITELRSRAESLQDRALSPAELRTHLEKYFDWARETYEDLAERGEKVINKAANRPGVKRVLDRAGDTVEAAAEGVEATVEAATKPKAPARKATVRRTAAK